MWYYFVIIIFFFLQCKYGREVLAACFDRRPRKSGVCVCLCVCVCVCVCWGSAWPHGAAASVPRANVEGEGCWAARVTRSLDSAGSVPFSPRAHPWPSLGRVIVGAGARTSRYRQTRGARAHMCTRSLPELDTCSSHRRENSYSYPPTPTPTHTPPMSDSRQMTMINNPAIALRTPICEYGVVYNI